MTALPPLLSADEAAVALGITPQAVTARCRAGRLDAVQVGAGARRTWVIPAESVATAAVEGYVHGPTRAAARRDAARRAEAERTAKDAKAAAPSVVAALYVAGFLGRDHLVVGRVADALGLRTLDVAKAITAEHARRSSGCAA